MVTLEFMIDNRNVLTTTCEWKKQKHLVRVMLNNTHVKKKNMSHNPEFRRQMRSWKFLPKGILGSTSLKEFVKLVMLGILCAS